MSAPDERARYLLRLRARNVIGSIELHASTLNAAKALAAEWARNLDRKLWSVEITNERGERVYIVPP